MFKITRFIKLKPQLIRLTCNIPWDRTCSALVFLTKEKKIMLTNNIDWASSIMPSFIKKKKSVEKERHPKCDLVIKVIIVGHSEQNHDSRRTPQIKKKKLNQPVSCLVLCVPTGGKPTLPYFGNEIRSTYSLVNSTRLLWSNFASGPLHCEIQTEQIFPSFKSWANT